jgi:hypothetical protein
MGTAHLYNARRFQVGQRVCVTDRHFAEVQGREPTHWLGQAGVVAKINSFTVWVRLDDGRECQLAAWGLESESAEVERCG